MHEKHLLLPSAKSGIMVSSSSYSRRSHPVRLLAVGVGLVCVLVGAADATSRLAKDVGGDNAAFLAFAPAAALNTPPAAAPAAAVSAPGSITPARLKIPALGINAAVEPVVTKADGTMATPQDFKNVSWWSPGAKPGNSGSAVFAGHVNNGLMSAGVFANLSKAAKGDYVTVSDADGRTKIYRVQSVTEYPADSSTEALFAATGPSQLVLITCDGDWVPAHKTFDKRLVVVATPAY